MTAWQVFDRKQNEWVVLPDAGKLATNEEGQIEFQGKTFNLPPPSDRKGEFQATAASGGGFLKFRQVAVEASPLAEVNSAKLLMLIGSSEGVGKSSVALGIIGALIDQYKWPPNDVAYIKPMTQCVTPQLVAKYCQHIGVANRGVGPVVFWKGFTRYQLDFEPNGYKLLDQVREAVQRIAHGKRLVIIDGVGFPSVGSTVGCSNADIARSLDAQVLYVCKSGVGEACDTFSRDAAYLYHTNARLTGVVFNKVAVTGFYSLQQCRTYVTKFMQHNFPQYQVYGFLPDISGTTAELGSGVCSIAGSAVDAARASAALAPLPSEEEIVAARKIIDTVSRNMDIAKLLQQLGFAN
eukprot:TRINITY_DN13462_c0_g1_i1.p1 TRINITY_DN13462_c0_g1~~TRINITY_DN13462_c0_g1_i1.p1  ORF type:complete len:360 (-),score=83.03 TRINITY_DN13462_c0_g1_i1:111-1163(-)